MSPQLRENLEMQSSQEFSPDGFAKLLSEVVVGHRGKFDSTKFERPPNPALKIYGNLVGVPISKPHALSRQIPGSECSFGNPGWERFIEGQVTEFIRDKLNLLENTTNSLDRIVCVAHDDDSLKINTTDSAILVTIPTYCTGCEVTGLWSTGKTKIAIQETLEYLHLASWTSGTTVIITPPRDGCLVAAIYTLASPNPSLKKLQDMFLSLENLLADGPHIYAHYIPTTSDVDALEITSFVSKEIPGCALTSSECELIRCSCLGSEILIATQCHDSSDLEMKLGVSSFCVRNDTGSPVLSTTNALTGVVFPSALANTPCECQEKNLAIVFWNKLARWEICSIAVSLIHPRPPTLGHRFLAGIPTTVAGFDQFQTNFTNLRGRIPWESFVEDITLQALIHFGITCMRPLLDSLLGQLLSKPPYTALHLLRRILMESDLTPDRDQVAQWVDASIRRIFAVDIGSFDDVDDSCCLLAIDLCGPQVLQSGIFIETSTAERPVWTLWLNVLKGIIFRGLGNSRQFSARQDFVAATLRRIVADQSKKLKEVSPFQAQEHTDEALTVFVHAMNIFIHLQNPTLALQILDFFSQIELSQKTARRLGSVIKDLTRDITIVNLTPLSHPFCVILEQLITRYVDHFAGKQPSPPYKLVPVTGTCCCSDQTTDPIEGCNEAHSFLADQGRHITHIPCSLGAPRQHVQPWLRKTPGLDVTVALRSGRSSVLVIRKKPTSGSCVLPRRDWENVLKTCMAGLEKCTCQRCKQGLKCVDCESIEQCIQWDERFQEVKETIDVAIGNAEVLRGILVQQHDIVDLLRAEAPEPPPRYSSPSPDADEQSPRKRKAESVEGNSTGSPSKRLVVSVDIP